MSELSVILPSLVGLAGVLLGYWLASLRTPKPPPPHQIADTTPPTTAELRELDWVETAVRATPGYRFRNETGAGLCTCPLMPGGFDERCVDHGTAPYDPAQEAP